MREVDCYIAALYRQNFVVETVKTILANPETKTITIIANKHTDEEFQNCIDGLLQANTVAQIPIYLYRGDNAKETNEKLKYVSKGKGKYISFIDNDLLLAPTHFQYLIAGCEKYGSYVSLHGAILNPLPLGSYYRDRSVFRGLKTVLFDTPVDIASNCGSLFKREFFDEKFYATVYNNAPTVGMDDLLMAVACQQRGIPRYVLKHQEGFMKHKIQYKEDDYCFDKYTKVLGVSDKVQTDYLNKNYKKL